MRRSMYVAVTVPYTKIVQVESYMWMDGCVWWVFVKPKKTIESFEFTLLSSTATTGMFQLSTIDPLPVYRRFSVCMEFKCTLRHVKSSTGFPTTTSFETATPVVIMLQD